MKLVIKNFSKLDYVELAAFSAFLDVLKCDPEARLHFSVERNKDCVSDDKIEIDVFHGGKGGLQQAR